MDSELKSPMKAIRAKCLDCCCGQKDEVKSCPSSGCPLWAFRLGKNPNRTRTLTEEQKKAAAERLARARAARKAR